MKPKPERLQKILARAGVSSRRAAEELIASGRVRVNGRIVSELGAKATMGVDRVEVDGKRLVAEKLVHFLLNKPRGVVTTLSDPEGRPTVRELLKNVPVRVFPVGRLDFHTSGALLITNDGELSAALLHPSSHVPKVYVAKVRGHLSEQAMQALMEGVELDDGSVTAPAHLFVLREEGANTWIQLTLYEGKNRQVHRMCEAIGHPVLRLSRQSFADLEIEGTRPGEFRELTLKEIEKLRKNYVEPLKPGGKPSERSRRESGRGDDLREDRPRTAKKRPQTSSETALLKRAAPRGRTKKTRNRASKR